MANLGKLIKQADAAAESASRLVLRAMREVRGELALLADELNLTGSAADRDKAYQMIQKKMARLSRRLDALMDAQNHLAGKTAAKSAEEMTGLEVKYSVARANAIIELVTPAQGENLAAVFTQNMASNSIRALQEATVAVMREQAVAGGTMKEMKKALGERWQKAISAPPVFTDAGGHTWDTGAYLQMNIRTNTMRVYNDCLVDDVARTTGSDLVRVSTGGDPMCRLCAPWEGVILSVSGKTKGFPTYEQARQAGCFHPNCVHTIETVDDVWDGEEIELQKAHPVTKETATDPDAMDERKYKMDQERYRRKGMDADAARLAVDRDNLEANIRHGLIRSDARAIVDKLTDAQVTALCKDGNPPRFEPTKKATKKNPHAADEKFIRGKRGGVVHISRNATVEDLVRVTRLEDAKMPEPVKEEESKPEPLPKFKTSKEAAEYIEKTYGIACKGFDKFSVEFCQGMVEAVADVKSHIGDSERLQGVWTFAEYYKKAYQLFRPKVEETVAKYYTGPIDSPENQKRIDALTKKKLRREGITKSSKNYGCAWFIPNSQYASLNGIVLNNTLDTMDRHSEVSSGFKAQGCENPLSTIYHELGHIIDYHLGIVDRTRTQITNDTIKALWNKGRDDVAKNLSRYGSTNPREMIAEAWAEYKMNPKARETALTIGKELDRLCAERMKKDV